MDSLPHSLSIAVWLTGSLWIVGLIGYLGDAPTELVIATFFFGLVAGACELRAANRKSGR